MDLTGLDSGITGSVSWPEDMSESFPEDFNSKDTCIS